MQGGLTALDDAAIRRIYVRAPWGASWWPSVLQGQLSAAAVRAAGLRVYRSDRAAFVFIDWQAHRAFYYRESA